MAMLAVSVTRLAARRPRLGLRWPLGERRRLPLAGTLEFGDEFGEPRHLRFEFRHSALKDEAVRTTRLGHAENLAKQFALSCASLEKKQHQAGRVAKQLPFFL